MKKLLGNFPMNLIIIVVLSSLFSCQKEIPEDILRIVDTTAVKSTGVYGWRTVYYDDPWSSVDSSLQIYTFSIDSLARTFTMRDSLRKLDEAIYYFNSNWQLRSIHIYDTTGDLFTIDSFPRNPAGEINRHLTMDRAGRVLQDEGIRLEKFTDSTRVHFDQLYPALEPSVKEFQRYFTVHNATQRLLSNYTYEKKESGGETIENIIAYKFSYATDGLLTGIVGGSSFHSLGTGFRSWSEDNSTATSTNGGTFEEMKLLDKLVYNGELGWYRPFDAYFPNPTIYCGWNGLTKLPAVTVSNKKEFNTTSGMTSDNNSTETRSYEIDSKGRLYKMKTEHTPLLGGFGRATTTLLYRN